MLRRESGVRVFAERTSEEGGFIPPSSSEMGSPGNGTFPGAIHVPNKLVNLIVKPKKQGLITGEREGAVARLA